MKAELEQTQEMMCPPGRKKLFSQAPRLQRVLVTSLALGLSVLPASGCRPTDPRSPFASGVAFDYPVVSATEQQRERIILEDFTILANADGAPAFEMRPVVASDGDERLYVLDPKSLEILVLDQFGEEQKRFGGRGLGFGKFTNPGHIAVVGDRLVVGNYTSAALQVLSLEGDFIDQVWPQERAATIQLVGLDTRTLLRTYIAPGVQDELVVARTWLDGRGEELFRIRLPVFPEGDVQGHPVLLDELSQYPRLAKGGGTVSYINAPAGYEVGAFDTMSGDSWVVRSPWEPIRFAPSLATALSTSIASLKEEFRPRFTSPEAFPVLSAIRVDGSGRLFVFPFTHVESYEYPADHPVDVYSPDGDLQVNAVIEIGGRSWLASGDDMVFGVVATPGVREFRIFRARPVLP